MKEKLYFKKIDYLATIPSYAHDGDSGMDIFTTEGFSLGVGERHTFSTGICANIPFGHELQVRPRSGLSRKGILAMYGTVDRNYKGEIGITLINLSGEQYVVKFGDRIAQLVLSKVEHCEIVETDDVGTSERGSNGFGSTGR